jgi:hypothetical protein
MFNNQVSNINLIDGLNMNPVPLEASQEMTTTKWLMAIQNKLNDIILVRNEVVNDANSYTDDKIDSLAKSITDLQNLINGSKLIPNQDIQNFVTTSVSNAIKTVSFGINNDGYFYAVIPSSWNEITFDTNDEGNLILKY